MSNNPYIPHSKKEIKEMLTEIGVSSIDDLYNDVPSQLDSNLDIPEASDEFSLKRKLKHLSELNTSLDEYAIFRGAGVYNHLIPAAVNSVASRGEFLTAYTPYQAEVSQGTLQMLFEFQSMITELTGMDIANSSMYDGASAVAEAALMASRVTRKEDILVASSLHPEYIDVLKTYCFGADLNVIPVKYSADSGELDIEDLKEKISDNTATLILGYPNFFGIIEHLTNIKESLPKKTLITAVINPIALGILEAPGKLGADIVVGEGQPLGNSMNLGGPGLGLFATKEKYIRKIPGRLIGQTKDMDGETGYAMILQTREQHIRREKATSNICSNHSFNALLASIYMSLMGKNGIKEIATRCLKKSHFLYEKLLKIEGISPVFDAPFFHEFVLRINKDTSIEEINKKLLKEKILGPLPLKRFFPNMEDCALFCATEAVNNEDITFFAGKLEEIL
ncbi:MAG: aminomethyl-transferring glycine dehydrogenase subunit GcvPA [Kosmotoga sp.]|nr:MAG: aminomethyl-transferring glycine dehydrogenase subunit GcvPA [Kosmotoga sp.]